MNEIVVISGKGGTGKTSLTASFAYLEGNDVVVADCDVDAANMHLLMEPDFNESSDFYCGEIAQIDQGLCIRCGKCQTVCRFYAIQIVSGIYKIDPLQCEGCGYCARICPTHAIINKLPHVGNWYISNIRTGTIMVHAKLGIGADNSGKLVAKVKNAAKEIAQDKSKNFVLVDGPPGIGCPVISSLSGADLAVIIIEATLSGLHDLIRINELVKKFKIKTCCIINKSDINTAVKAEIEAFIQKENITHIANLPYNEDFTRAMVMGQTVVEYSGGQVKELVKKSWNKIKQIANNN